MLDGNTSVPMAAALAAIAWNEAGLVPAIAQDALSSGVLMLAWMNRDALVRTLETKAVHYYSRSRQRLWRKGETSGNTQKLISMHLDCDNDALLLRVAQTGVACHTGSPSCFYRALIADNERAVATAEASGLADTDHNKTS